jgi:MFS family permease
MLTAPSLGGLLLNYPMGWLADRVNRTALAVTWLTLSAGGVALLPLVVPAGMGALPFFVVLGGIMSGTYSLAIVLVGARFRAAELAAASTVFTLMYNAGALAGPAAAGLALGWLGPIGLIVVMSSLLGLCIPFGLLALRRKRA